MRLGLQIGLLLGLVLVVVLGGFGGFAYSSAKRFLIEDAEAQMASLAATHEVALQELLSSYEQQARLIATRTRLRDLVAAHNTVPQADHRREIRRILDDVVAGASTCGVIEIRDVTGRLLVTTSETGDAVELEYSSREGRMAPLATHVHGIVRLGSNTFCIALYSPLVLNDALIGSALVLLPNDRLVELFGGTMISFESGETLLARRGPDDEAVFLHPLRRRAGPPLSQRVAADRTDVPITHAMAGRELVLSQPGIVDYHGVPVVAATRYVEVLDWGIVAKVDRAELLAPVRRLLNQLLGASAVVVAVLGLVALLVTRRITGPLRSLEQTATAVAGGSLEERAEPGGSREVGQVAVAFNAMLDRLVAARGELVDQTRSLKRALGEVKERQAVIATLADSVPLGIYAKDTDMRYVLVNRTLERWYDRPREAVLGRTAEEVFGAEPASELAELRARALRGETTHFDGELRYPDGETRDVALTYLPHRRSDGRIVGIFCVAEDVTEARAREYLLRQSHKREALGRLTGGVAHDFNNLLTTVIGNLDMLKRSGELDEDDVQRLDRALQAARRGSELTAKLLGTARMDDLQPQRLDVNALLRGMHDLLARSLSEEITLDLELADGLPLVHVDPGELEHAILNLVLNAADAVAQTGRIRIDTGVGDVRGSRAGFAMDLAPGSYVIITVADDGTGIPKDQQERVFDPFFTTKGRGAGTGLGLSTVYSFARQSRGGVALYSEEGEGTSVRLYLPAAGGGKATVEGVSQENGPTAGALPGGHETILVVEDEQGVRDLAVAMLEDLGYGVVAAASGPEALDVLEGREDVDLVVSDVIMPGGMSGADVAREVAVRWPHIPVLLVSGYAEDHLARSGRLGHEHRLLRKPFDQGTLAQAIRGLLERP